MLIKIQVSNTTTGEQVFTASAPDIDSAIAELGSIGRAMDSYICPQCKEPTSQNKYCCEDCAEEAQKDREYDLSLTA